MIKIINLTEKTKINTMHTSRSLTAFIFLSFMFMSYVYADDKFSQTKNGKLFLNNVVIEHNEDQLNMFLTGLTTRRKFFVNIYSVAHYIEQKAGSTNQTDPISGNSTDKICAQLLQDKRTKQISMVFLRTLKAKQIRKSLLSNIQSNTSDAEYSKIQPQVEEFMRAIYSDVKKNDEFVIRWFPDGTLVALSGGQEISSIKSDSFAKTLWLIWFGEKSTSDRKSLIKKLLTSS